LESEKIKQNFQKKTAIFRTFTTLLKKDGKFAKLILSRCKKSEGKS